MDTPWQVPVQPAEFRSLQNQWNQTASLSGYPYLTGIPPIQHLYPGKAASRLPFSFVSSSPFGDSQYPKVIFFGVSLSFACTFVKFPPANTDVMISAAAAATVKILFAFMSFLLRLYIVSCHGIAFLIRSLSPPSMSSAIPPIIKIPA